MGGNRGGRGEGVQCSNMRGGGGGGRGGGERGGEGVVGRRVGRRGRGAHKE